MGIPYGTKADIGWSLAYSFTDLDFVRTARESNIFHPSESRTEKIRAQN